MLSDENLPRERAMSDTLRALGSLDGHCRAPAPPTSVVPGKRGARGRLGIRLAQRVPRSRRLARTHRPYLALRWSTPLILVLSAVGLALRWPSLAQVRVLGVIAVSFGVIEYVNCFVLRVSYPVATWWRDVRQLRQPRLIRDVRRGLAPR